MSSSPTREHHMPDEPANPDDRDDAPFEDKDEAASSPARPTPSDDATLVERDEGAHAEFVDAPQSMEDADARDRSTRSDDEDDARG